MTTDGAQRDVISRAALVDQLSALGVTSGIALVVHTSFRAVRPVADGPLGLIWALYDLDGWVLLLGVDHSSNTTIHLGEAVAGVPYGLRKWATVLREGRPRRVVFREADHCCRRFAFVEDWLTDRGLQREGTVGHARARLVRARDVVAVVTAHLRQDRTFFLCPPDEPCDECPAAWASIGAWYV